MKEGNGGDLSYRPLIVTTALVVAVLFLAILGALQIARDSNSRLDTYFREFLALYSVSISEELVDGVEDLILDGTALMRLSPRLSDEEIREDLRSMVENSRSILNNIVMLKTSDTGETEVLYPYYRVTPEELERLLDTPTVQELSPIIRSGRAKQLVAYQESLGDSTILPYLVTDYERQCSLILFINLTSLLAEKTSEEANNSLLSSSIAFDTRLYSPMGLLLETSDNRSRQVLSTLKSDDVFPELSLYDEAQQLYSYDTGEDVWMMKKGNNLGLSVAIKAPMDVVNESARTTTVIIAAVAGLCLLSIFLVIISSARTLRSYQAWARLQDEARFESLQSKMNPHLFFNTLDGIAYSAEKNDQESVLQSLKALSYILQTDLRETAAELPLMKEMRYLFSFVQLQEIRYRGRFSFDLDTDLGDHTPDDVYVLRYSVQPLVENAFKYSVHQGAEGVSIQVRYEVSGNSLLITVRNDHSTVTESDHRSLVSKLALARADDRGHLGLMSIDQRIKLRYGKEYGLSLPYEPGSFIVLVTLPLITD